MSEAVYFVRSKGRVTGPFAVDMLQILVRRGTISRVDEVSSDRAAWVSAVEFEGLFPVPQAATFVPESGKSPQVKASQDSNVESTPPRYVCSVCREFFTVEGIHNISGRLLCQRCFAVSNLTPMSGTPPVLPTAQMYSVIDMPDASGNYSHNQRWPSTPIPAQRGQHTTIAIVGGPGLVVAGYVCGLLAFILWTPGFGTAGAIFGIANIALGEVGHGIAQIVLAILCMATAVMLRALVMSMI
ncbi:MAG: hypothetical protein WCJ97_11900 [Phycisphaerae bacterium]